ncbi:hypothetical protein TNCT_358561 [Trichonephila clavata]|uniref:Uncharacterized protein n=1 Tax=Trichonephila clavata TaxID=2740835 RepID=A0A8X6KR05_TRICU|nr:hypothetical protein TNCT_358561 [Trichonephila clavata]
MTGTLTLSESFVSDMDWEDTEVHVEEMECETICTHDSEFMNWEDIPQVGACKRSKENATPAQPKKVSVTLDPKPNPTLQGTPPTPQKGSPFSSEFIRHKIRSKPKVSIPQVPKLYEFRICSVALRKRAGYFCCGRVDPRPSHQRTTLISFHPISRQKADGPISYRSAREGDVARLDFPGAVQNERGGVREGRTALEEQQVADLQVVFLGQRCSPINGEQRLTGYFEMRSVFLLQIVK